MRSWSERGSPVGRKNKKNGFGYYGLELSGDTLSGRPYPFVIKMLHHV
jgi:hypothetical protein